MKSHASSWVLLTALASCAGLVAAHPVMAVTKFAKPHLDPTITLRTYQVAEHWDAPTSTLAVSQDEFSTVLPGCDVSIESSLLTTTSLKNMPAVNEINRVMSRVVRATVDRAGDATTSTDSLDTLVRADIAACKQAQEEAIASHDLSGYTANWNHVTLESEVVGQDLIQAVLNMDRYENDVHPMQSYDVYLFDARTGKQWSLENIIQPQHLQDFVRLEARRILKLQYDDYGLTDATIARLKKLAGLKTRPSAAVQRALYGKDSLMDFDIDVSATGITTHYTRGYLNDYFNGNDVDIDFRYKELRPWLTKEFAARVLAR